MSKSSKTFWAFMTGAAVGSILGILYAPDKGENTRNKLFYQLQKYRDQLQGLISDLIEGKEIPETILLPIDIINVENASFYVS